MSVREEDKQKTSCPSRGLGLAAAAIGVGVGAALYYFFSKRPENPDGEGSTSNWRCEEQPQALPSRTPHLSTMSDSDDFDSQYSTVSEHTTSDASMDADRSASETEAYMSFESYISGTSSTDTSHSDSDNYLTEESELTPTDSESGSTDTDTDSSDSENDDQSDRTFNAHNEIDVASPVLGRMLANDTLAVESMMNPRINVSVDNSFVSHRGSESEIEREWDITNNARDVPRVLSRRRSPVLGWLSSMTSIMRAGNMSRERSWSLEECSICFEVMLNNQELKKLPCTHNFHAACIDPWLDEQQTCPNCRKQA